MKQRILRGLIYTLFAIFALLVGIYLTFPTSVLADVIKAQGEAALGYQYTIEIEDVSLAGLTGVTVEGLRLIPVLDAEAEAEAARAEAEEGDEGETTTGPPTLPLLTTEIEEATVVVNVLSLLGGDPEVTLEATIGGGDVYVAWRHDEEIPGGHRLSAQVRDVPILSLGLLINAISAPLSGSIGSIDAVVRLDPAGQIVGERIDIRLDELTRSPGWQALSPSAGLTLLTPIRLGRLWLSAEFDEGHVNIAASNVANPYGEGPRSANPPIAERDMDLTLEGRITPRQPAAESTARLTMQVDLDNTFVEANDLGRPLRQIPPMSRACDNNACAFLLTGPVARIQLQPWRRAR